MLDEKNLEVEKKWSKKKYCLVAVIVVVLLIVDSVVGVLILEAPNQVTEPYTKLDIEQINQAVTENQLVAENKYKQKDDGYKYRYTFVAQVIDVSEAHIFVNIANPKSYRASNEWNYYGVYLNVDKEFATTLETGDWVLVENACIEFGQTWYRIDQQYLKTPKKITYEEAIEFVNAYPEVK